MSALRCYAALVMSALVASGCVDFSAALEDCARSGKCGDRFPDAAVVTPDGGELPDAGGPDAGGGFDAGCVDLDLDGLGSGCGLPDCDDTDGQRPLQLPCKEGAFVCRTCPTSSDNNSGSQASPLKTIAQGISYARSLQLPEVVVANRDRFNAAIYTESFDMAEGVSVRGQYYVEDGGFVFPSAERTSIHNTRPEGIAFRGGIGRGTKLSGFTIRTLGGDAAAAVTIVASSPTLEDLFVGFPLGALNRSYGVYIEGVDGGTPTNPAIYDSEVNAGSARSEAVGVYVSRASVELRGGQAVGGAIGDGGIAVGLKLTNAPGASTVGTTLIGCSGNPGPLTSGSCRGVESTGNVTGIVISGSDIVGCFDECPTGAATSENTGVFFAGCGEWDGGVRAVVGGNPSITGARVNSGASLARGVWVVEGCGVNIQDNASITGAEAAGAQGNVVGVQCSGAKGIDPSCLVRGNVIQSNRTGAPVVAFAGFFGCSSCNGGVEELIDNDFDMLGTTTAFSTVWVQNASPLVARNRVNLRQSDTACTYARGMVFVDSSARVENNFIRGGSCQDAIAVIQQQTVPGPGITMHSNTVTGGESNSSVGIGIYVIAPTGAPPAGRFINNIFTSGPVPGTVTRHAMTFSFDSLPIEVRNNLVTATSQPGPFVTGWGASVVNRSAAQLNTQPYGRDNIDAPTGFASPRNLHLSATSGARDAGTTEGGPLVDIDGDPRPAPDAGRSTAIGADEPTP